MARDILAISEGLLAGRLSIQDHPPITLGGTTEAVEVGDGIAFVESFANVTALDAGGSLALIDAGGVLHAAEVHRAVREWTASPLEWAVYTHGHVDHCFSVPLFEAEGSPVTVVAHEAVADRFDRYRLTEGYNGVINMRQFRLGAPLFPTDFRYPDRTYREHLSLEVGGTAVELHHDRGETDDHTWAFLPEQEVLCTGDLFVWVSPNCGNPQKAQRYPREWAAALRRMAELRPQVLLPGHGLPVIGEAEVAMVLGDAAALLESIVEQCLALMNAGARLDALIHEVVPPAGLLERPWLTPIYDDPEFIVHTMWRLYGGWYDGNPATLKPSPEAVLATEIADLAGGARRLADRAAELAEAGDLRLAAHLVETAALAAPDDSAVHEVRAAVFGARVAAESSLMAKGIFSWAEHESTEAVSRLGGAGAGEGAEEPAS